VNSGLIAPTKCESDARAEHSIAFTFWGVRQVVPYTIDDPITDPLTCSVEVTIDIDGQKRWLFFATPQLLASVGDFVEGTRVRFHLGERHMVVVSELSEPIIRAVLSRLQADGELVSRTLPLEPQ
jgi:hypothetical protein